MKEVGPHSSRSCNYNVNGGPTRGGNNSPKSEQAVAGMGGDEGRDATNTISKPGCNPPEVGPSSTSQSANRYKGTSKY